MVIKRTTNLSVLDNIIKRKEETTQKNREVLNKILDDFLKEHTRFESFKSLLLEAGFKYEPSEDFKNIPQQEIDKFVSENTEFENLAQLRDQALSKFL